MSHLFVVIKTFKKNHKGIVKMSKALNTDEVVELYKTTNKSMRDIATQLKTNHKVIGRILKKEGVEVERRKKGYKLTNEHKQKLSDKKKGKVPPNKGKKMNEATNRQNMVSHLKRPLVTKEILQKYEDFNKLKFLNKVITRHRDLFDDKQYIEYIDKFYFDTTFNTLYDRWETKKYNKWYIPSLDHIIPKSKGGTFDLDNLRFVTWFENRAKVDMDIQEWEELKRISNMSSDLFL